MLRQKFFTAVSLFGISFTIMIFSVSTSLFDLCYGNNAPAVNRSRTLHLKGISFYSHTMPYSYVNMDSNLYKELGQSEYVEQICLYISGSFRTFSKDKVVTFPLAYTDEQLWNIYDYRFLEGRPYNNRDIASGKRYAVISESVRKFYFGDGKAVGRSIGDDEKFEVIGVVKDMLLLNSEGPEGAVIWVPYSAADAVNNQSKLSVILARTAGDIPDIKETIVHIVERTEMYKLTKGSSVKLDAGTIYEKKDFGYAVLFIVVFLFFIVIIPALNMVGLNVNRISERSSEIGIRKAFGASSAVLAGQFIVENIIITAIGGVLGVLLTLAVSDQVVNLLFFDAPESVHALEYGLISWRTILYSVLSIIFFGLLSGIIPAWRMSRLHAIQALKGGSTL